MKDSSLKVNGMEEEKFCSQMQLLKKGFGFRIKSNEMIYKTYL